MISPVIRIKLKHQSIKYIVENVISFPLTMVDNPTYIGLSLERTFAGIVEE